METGSTLIVCEVSRLSRSVLQFCEIMETVKTKHLRLIVLGSITVDCRNGEMDPMSAAFLQMASIFSELEKNILRARVKSGMENVKEKGRQIGRRPTTKDDIPAVFYKPLSRIHFWKPECQRVRQSMRTISANNLQVSSINRMITNY